MAPGTRRANRSGYAEHDDFDGLPVRQWRHEWVNVAPPVEQEQQQPNDFWGVELIHGMPKDSNLLAPHSQELLRAARSGQLYKRSAPNDDDDGDMEANVPEKAEKKEEEPAQKGFPIKIWKQVPRNVEGSELSHLAKRRRNVVTIASKTVEERIQGPTVTRATVRRTDAAGNPYTEEVTLIEGQAVDGEIISTRVEAVQVPNPSLTTHLPPLKKRAPPPKRKAKAGPGRGKKKNRDPIPGQAQATEAAPIGQGPDAVQAQPNGTETPNVESNGNANQDSEMADGDDDDDDDDDDGHDGDEGDDSELPENSTVEITQDIGDTTTDVNMSDVPTTTSASGEASDAVAPSTAIAPPLGGLATGSPKPEGSPLKNVTLAPTTAESNAAEVNSNIAEPPSSMVGEESERAAEGDVPMLKASEEEALLPPPPEQVGNIATPKADDSADRGSDTEDKTKDSQQDEAALQDKVLSHQDTIMTEDTIKPEDSASVGFPRTESGAPSEVGTGSVNGGGDPVAPASVAEEEKPPASDMDVDAKPPAPVSLATIVAQTEELKPEPTNPSAPGSTVAQVATPAAVAEPAKTAPLPEVEEQPPADTAVPQEAEEKKDTEVVPEPAPEPEAKEEPALSVPVSVADLLTSETATPTATPAVTKEEEAPKPEEPEEKEKTEAPSATEPAEEPVTADTTENQEKTEEAKE